MEPKKVIKLKRKYAIILVVALLGLFGLVMGASYAFFTNTVRGKEYVVYSGTLAISYEKKTNVVNLNNTKPMTNSEGLATTAYSFDVKNTGTIEEKYQVRLEEDTNNTLPLEYVKISVYKNDVELIKPTKLSELSTNIVIAEGTLDSLGSDNYKVRLWVDINTSNDMVGKEFKARVVIDGMQDVEEGFAVNTKPVITLKKDSNNNTNLLLNVGDTYVEPGVESVRDDKDTISPNNVAITGTVNTNVAGIYTVTYSVTDSDNNTSTVTRTVAVNDGSIPIYNSISEVVNSFNSNDLKDAIICDHIYGDGDLYLDCEIKNTLENAIAARNVSTIIMTNNVTVTNTLSVNDGKDITLNVNGKNINGYANVFYVRGGTLHLVGDGVITDNSTSVNTQNGAIKIWGSHNSKLIVDSGTCDTLDPTNHTTGLLLYSGDNNQCAIANYGAYDKDTQTADIIINGGCYYSTSGRSVVITGNTNVQINDAYMYGGTNAIYVSTTLSNVKTNINGGTFIGGTSPIMNNGASGLININQTTKPIYIKSTSETWDPAIINNSSGVINITAPQANACTTNASDTTSGLCVYAIGNGSLTTNDGNGAVRNNTGIINVIGGTFVGGRQGFNNQTGTINIDGANINSVIALENWGTGTTNVKNSIINGRAENGSTGTVNMCDSTLTTGDGSADLNNNQAAGIINYNNVTFSNGTTTPDNSKIYNPNGTITESATCPISN